jgi:hypothetical protein
VIITIGSPSAFFSASFDRVTAGRFAGGAVAFGALLI